MSDERRDDEIIGRALSRAIETIDVNETPYAASRLVAAPRRPVLGFWQLAGVTAGVVLAVAVGAWFNAGREGSDAGPVAASPTPSSIGTSSPTNGCRSSSPNATAIDHQVIYLVEIGGQPPFGCHLEKSTVGATADDRVRSRLMVLVDQVAVAGTPLVLQARFDPLLAVTSARVQGDLVTVDFAPPLDASGGPAWVLGTRNSDAIAALQEIVYTATEEPGIRRVLITQDGGKPAKIGQIAVTRPLSREDVLGYAFSAAIGKDQSVSWGGDDSLQHVGGRLDGVGLDGATTVTATIDGISAETGARANLPSFTIELIPTDDTRPNNGKYELTLKLNWNGGGSSGGVGHTTFYDLTPVRAISTDGTTFYQFELDDARPWRAYMPDKTRLVIEIGGDPRATSDRIAVTTPQPGGIANSGTDLRVAGSARVFEANVSWRLLDSGGKNAASGHFNASLGSSALWGTFDARLPLPANVRGNVTLEFFESSPKDGSAQGLVQIPLTVR